MGPTRSLPIRAPLAKQRKQCHWRPRGRFAGANDVDLGLEFEDGLCLCTLFFRSGRRLLRRTRHVERGTQCVEDGLGTFSRFAGSSMADSFTCAGSVKS